VEPSRLYQSRQFLSDFVRQIDIYGFHSNSVLEDQSICTHALRVNPTAGSVKASQVVRPVRWSAGDRRFAPIRGWGEATSDKPERLSAISFQRPLGLTFGDS
jgi:hypothetical protein